MEAPRSHSPVAGLSLTLSLAFPQSSPHTSHLNTPRELSPGTFGPLAFSYRLDDELLELGETPSKGKIVNSNSYGLAAAVKSMGAIPVMLGIARDTLESHREKIESGLEADALITSAGVSVGDRDFVRGVLTDLAVEQVFWRVDVRPGKSLAFGIKDGKPVFALPGNPVSTMLTFEEFVAPALLKMMGHNRLFKQLIRAEL